MNEAILAAIKFAKEGAQQFLNTFQALPEDKLNWSPSATARSAIQIAAHTAVCNFDLARGMENGQSRFASLEEYHKHVEAEEAKIKTREQALKAISDSKAEVERVLTDLNASRLNETVITPFGNFPMSEMIYWPGNHCYMHASQIDYIQTILGDMAMHF